MTSRDLTENVEQLQVIRSLDLVRVKAVACLNKLAERAGVSGFNDYGPHAHVPPRRLRWKSAFAMAGQELLVSLDRLHDLVERYPARGLKGSCRDPTGSADAFRRRREKGGPVGKEYREASGFGKVLAALAKSIQGVLIWIQLPPWSSWLLP